MLYSYSHWFRDTLLAIYLMMWEMIFFPLPFHPSCTVGYKNIKCKHTHTHTPSFLACSAWLLLPSTSMATKECSWHFRLSERSGQLVVGPSTSYNMLDCYDLVPFHWEWRMGASSSPPPPPPSSPIVFSRLNQDNLVEHHQYTKKLNAQVG